MKSQNLTKRFIANVTEPGKHYDNRHNGLYLKVSKTGSKAWGQRVRNGSGIIELGLGLAKQVSLDDARNKAIENQRLARAGMGAQAIRKNERNSISLENSSAPMFRAALQEVYKIKKAKITNEKNRRQWISDMENHAKGLFDFPVDMITERIVSDKVLRPIWLTKPIVAKRVRRRIGNVMDWAKAMGYRDTDNPTGKTLDFLLPAQGHTEKHFQSLPHAQVSQALAKLDQTRAKPAVKLLGRFITLTACRSGEARGARWSEFDLENETWVIPAERMKMKREHRVPLSKQAIEVLESARKLRRISRGLVFASAGNYKTARPISNSTLSKLFREQKMGCTPHGMRASFRNWCAETGVSREVAELSLAHANEDKTEAAYFTSDLLERRRPIMQAWADYLQS